MASEIASSFSKVKIFYLCIFESWVHLFFDESFGSQNSFNVTKFLFMSKNTLSLLFINILIFLTL